jgi:hypothetical protein
MLRAGLDAVRTGTLWTFFDKTLHGPFWQLILSYKFYGMLLLCGAIVLANVRAGAIVGMPAHPQPQRASLWKPKADLASLGQNLRF